MRLFQSFVFLALGPGLSAQIFSPSEPQESEASTETTIIRKESSDDQKGKPGLLG